MRTLALVAAAVAAGSAPGLSSVREGWIVLDGKRVVRGGSPAWSSDGRLAFVRDGWIWVRGRGRLVRGESPAWSPDVRRIAFVRGDELFLIRPDATGERRLTRKAKIWWEDRSPTWSPDGRRIAFASNRAGFFNSELYTIGVDGRGLARLTHTAGSDDVLGDDGMPSWSPDGRQLAFVSNRDRNFELYLLRLDGLRVRRLTRTPGADEALPRWSPDGRRISFSFTPHHGKPQLHILELATGRSTSLGLGDAPAWRG